MVTFLAILLIYHVSFYCKLEINPNTHPQKREKRIYKATKEKPTSQHHVLLIATIMEQPSTSLAQQALG